jgi:hypothetical protein
VLPGVACCREWRDRISNKSRIEKEASRHWRGSAEQRVVRSIPETWQLLLGSQRLGRC